MSARHRVGAGLLAFGLLGGFERARNSSTLSSIVQRRRRRPARIRLLARSTFATSSSCSRTISLDDPVRLGQRLGHLVFGHFAGKAFDHQHRVAAAGNDQVEFAFFQLDPASETARTCRRSCPTAPSQSAPGTAAARGPAPPRRRSSPTRRHRSADRWPARTLESALRRKSPSGNSGRIGRSISRDGERFLHRRPAFALQEAAGKLAGRGRPLAIIASQREEIAAARSRRATGHGGNHDRFAILHQATAGRLLGEKSCFDGKYAVSDLLFYSYFQCFVPDECVSLCLRVCACLRCTPRMKRGALRWAFQITQATRNPTPEDRHCIAYLRISSRLMMSM